MKTCRKGLTNLCYIALLLSINGCAFTRSVVPTGVYADELMTVEPGITSAPQVLQDSTITPEVALEENAAMQTAQTSVSVHYTINDYVRNMAQDLIANMEQVSPTTPVGITDFAWLDSQLYQSNVLALQMSEGFKHHFHQFRIPVVEFGATGFIRVTGQGNFYLSRDHTDLNIDVPMEYILTGTLAMHIDGVFINARVVDVTSKHIVASAQALIPAHIANAVSMPYENVIAEHLQLLSSQ